jgi:predicted enzyme related to lactoylglutathione lyase
MTVRTKLSEVRTRVRSGTTIRDSTEIKMPVARKLIATTVDCPDPRALAAFYHALTGWKITYEDDDYAAVSPADGQPGVNFLRVDGYTAPQWPGQGQPQQFHLDFYTDDDLDTAQAVAQGFGASLVGSQPQPDRWRVLLDRPGTRSACARARQARPNRADGRGFGLLETLSAPTARARVWRGLTQEGAVARTRAEHRAILDALAARDPETARAWATADDSM